jgi:hypothetical protein
MKKALLHIMLMLLMVLISCELKEDDTSGGGDTVDPTEETITITSPTSGDTLNLLLQVMKLNGQVQQIVI